MNEGTKKLREMLKKPVFNHEDHMAFLNQLNQNLLDLIDKSEKRIKLEESRINENNSK